MLMVILWVFSVLACLGYGCVRIYTMYKLNLTNKEYLTHGFVLITYSTLIVGATGFLSNEVNKYHKSLSYTSDFWIGVELFSSLLQYLAPFVFAAIGVNMVSHALTNKNT
ncbi:hypothetical protein [Aeromonas rivipollensis]|uniref:hypothetical protein n=1 Tax=Aeromonas rivipollensis TaxID=948519 RepID=UPI003D1CBBF4